jgi:ribonuclease HI
MTKKYEWTIHGDGGARGNPGPAGAGAVIRDHLGNTVAVVSKFLGKQTNNFAEYEAVISAFEELDKLLKKTPSTSSGQANVVVKLDSMLVVRQMQGEWRTKHPNIKPQQAKLASLISHFGKVTFQHVYREQNADADALANEAMDRGTV